MDNDNSWFKLTVQDEMEKNEHLTWHQIDSMKQWLQQQPQYPPICDLELVLFIQSCDFDIDQAKKTLEFHYKMRTKCQLFKNRSPDKELIKKSRDSVKLFILNGKDESGNVIGGGKLFDTDTSKYHPEGFMEEAVMALEVYQLEHGTVPGIIIIIDVKGTTLKHLFKLSFSSLKAIFQYAQEAITMKIKGLHFINTKGSVIDTLMGFIRPFLKESLLHKVHFHQGFETLKDFINAEVLPDEYGGNSGELLEQTKRFEEKLNNYKKYFSLDDSRIIDESKIVREKSKYFPNWF